MNDFLIYLLKVSGGSAIIYILYLAVFSRDTFYLRNRILLIIALLLPPVFPLLKIPVKVTRSLETANPGSIDSSVFSGNTIDRISGTVNSINYYDLIMWVYFLITAVLLLRVLISLASTYSIIRKGTIVNNQFPKVVVSNKQLPPFSFFPYVVIPSEDYRSRGYTDILDHEFAHVTQGHTFDLLLSELFIVFQWFNPFAWLVKRSIVLNHEYLADSISLRNYKSVIEYQYRLLNFQSGLKHVSLAHNFNSLIKNRIIMINKNRTPKYAALKTIIILPVVAIIVYAFATPDYRYSDIVNDKTISINRPLTIIQKEVRGVVVNKDGKPIEGADIVISELGKATVVRTDKGGRFSIIDIQEDATLLLSARGYMHLSVKPDFNQEMRVIMEIDPDYKEVPPVSEDNSPKPLVVLDRVVTEMTPEALFSKMGSEIATVKSIQGKEATVKYGEAGKNGVLEAYTVKGAKEFGIVVPFVRRTPDDFPTFLGEKSFRYTDWLIDKMQYPAEATANGIQGRITVKFTVEADGSIDNIVPVGNANQVLGDAVVNAIQASPKWEPAKNPEAREPFEHLVTLKFELPGKILKNGEAFVVVEEMPMYPGGEEELLKFLAVNTNYPEAARNEKIQGKVIVRFIVSASGDAEEAVVLKGVHQLLDEEAVRVVSLLKGFIPGKQGGQAVDVYYMVPVNFSLPTADLSR
jgi:TonB family protein